MPRLWMEPCMGPSISEIPTRSYAQSHLGHQCSNVYEIHLIKLTWWCTTSLYLKESQIFCSVVSSFITRRPSFFFLNTPPKACPRHFSNSCLLINSSCVSSFCNCWNALVFIMTALSGEQNASAKRTLPLFTWWPKWRASTAHNQSWRTDQMSN